MGISVKLGRFLFALIFLVVCVTDVAYAQRRYPTRADFPAGTRFIAITFDDGPNNKYTVEILNILGQHNARGTFFVNPQKFDNPTLWHPSGGSDGRGGGGLHTNTLSVIRRMIAEGHDVENHTFDHQSMGGAQDYTVPPARDAATARGNLRRASQAIFNATGYWPFAFRAPFFEWGGGNNILFNLDRDLNMVFKDSGVNPNDFLNQGSGGRNTIANFVLNQTNDALNGGNVLLHDCGGGRTETVEAVRLMVPALRARGFEIVTVRELFMIKAHNPDRTTVAERSIPEKLLGTNMWPRVNQFAPSRRGQWDPFEPLWATNWWTNRNQWRCITPPWDRSAPTVGCGTCNGCRGTTNPVQTWTVTFDLAGGTRTGGGQLSQTVNNGANATLPTVTRTGHTLTGWSGSHTNVTSNRTITAQWQPTSGGDPICSVCGNRPCTCSSAAGINLVPWGDAGWSHYVEGDSNGVDRGSRVNITSPGQTGNMVANLQLGTSQTPNYAWLGLQLWLADANINFSGITGVRITYTANNPVRFVLCDETSTGAPNWTPTGAVLDAGTHTVNLTLQQARAGLSNPASTNIRSLTFYHVEQGQTVSLTVTSLTLIGAQWSGGVSIPQTRNPVRTTNNNALAINGLNAGILSLNVANSGMYNVSIHDVSGKMLAQTNANLAAGVNSLQIGQNIARGVVIVRIQGTNANLVRRISVR